MKNISISSELKAKCPSLIIGVLSAHVENSKFNKELWNEINQFSTQLQNTNSTEDIKNHKVIESTRKAYKACGKDPSRYRPSSESLQRRVIKGQDLYQINTLVDLVNYASLVHRHSIGGFDESNILGENLCIGIGLKNEEYLGIGRGKLNIENLPVLRDNIGGIGTPTSDHERTSMQLNTQKILCVVNGYEGNIETVQQDILHLRELLLQYANATNIQIQYIDQ